MLHVTCDLCGKEIRPGEDGRHVVRIEIYAADDPAKLTESDLDADHMEAVGELLRELEDSPADLDDLEPPHKHFRYDLCSCCRKKFVRNPLGKEAAQKFDFSEN